MDQKLNLALSKIARLEFSIIETLEPMYVIW